MTNTEKRLEEFDRFVNSFTDEQSRFHTKNCRSHLHDRNCPTIEIKKNIKSFISTKLQQAIAEDRKMVREKWDKYVDVINEDAHYVIHNPVREGFKVVLSSLDKPLTNKE